MVMYDPYFHICYEIALENSIKPLRVLNCCHTHALISELTMVKALRPVNASSKNLAINETMVGFRGHFGAKQYAPKKHSQMGHQGVQHG